MTRILRIAALTVLLGGTVSAQPGGAPAGSRTEIEARAPTRAVLTPQEMRSQSRDLRTQMTDVSNRVGKLVDAARRQKDVIKLNCVVDKQAQVRASIAVADQSITSLEDAIARKDNEGAVHEYTRVTIVHQKVQVLGAESEGCVGEDLTFVGAARVDVDDEGVPPEDYTVPMSDRPAMDRPVERPAAASPMTMT